MSAPPGAFSGLNVLDLSDRLSGAFAARLFGDFGADVLLAEPAGDHTLRHEPPFANDGRHSPVHAYVNWNKRSTTFTALAELETAVRAADLVVSTDLQTAEQIAGWLSAATVHLCVTAHGNRGALSRVPGNNLTTSARTGWSYINRLRGEPPLMMPRHQSGYVGGIAGFIAASAALCRREAANTPERVDVSEVEAFAHTVHPWGIMSIYADQGDSHGPAGWRPRGKPGPLWDVGGGRMHLAIADFHNWTQAMDALGLPDIGRRQDLIPDMGRHGRDLREVVTKLGETLPGLDRWQVFHQLAELRCVVGVMQDTADVLDDAQYAARGYITRTTVGGKTVCTAGAPVSLSPGKWQLRRPAPNQAEHRPQPADAQHFPASTFTTPPSTSPSASASMSLPPTDTLRRGPLSGLRVLSFGQAWSGTFGTQIFALLGADVVQLGALQRPDVWRRVRNEVPAGVRDDNKKQHALNTQGLYNSVNLNKRELTLNLKDPRGMALLWRLLPNFDIVIDNFRANVMPSWGITLEKLNEVRPGIIWGSISGYGTHGPYSTYPANGASTEPMSGLSSLHGYAGDPGMNTAGLFPDPVSGYVLAAGVMAAIHHRNRTGAPQRVDLAMMEAVTTLCGDALIEYQLTGKPPCPMGNHHPRFAPHNNFACKNTEWLALAVETDAQWQTLAALIGGELTDPLWRDAAYRKRRETRLDELIGAWCSSRSAADTESLLCGKGIPAARVTPLYELYTRAGGALYDSGFIQPVAHPEAGTSLLPGSPWHFAASADTDLRPAPCVGEHSREVLHAELGLTDAEYQDLVAAGVTGTLTEFADREQNSRTHDKAEN